MICNVRYHKKTSFLLARLYLFLLPGRYSKRCRNIKKNLNENFVQRNYSLQRKFDFHTLIIASSFFCLWCHESFNSRFKHNWTKKQSGAVEACWAHNPEVCRSKLRSANILEYISDNIDFICLKINIDWLDMHN